MPKRFLIIVTVASSALALPHLLPPIASGFVVERYWLTASRVVQGLPELAAFSVLSIVGLMSQPAMFSLVVGLSILLALAIRKMALSRDELADIVPALLFVIVLLGVLSVYGGGTIVAPSRVCTVGPEGVAVRKIVGYRELGWEPGAHYFLVERDQTQGGWTQTGYVRREAPESDPCSSIDGLFPP